VAGAVFAKRGSRGDPYEATLVLPATLVIFIMRMNELHKVSDLAMVVALVVTGLVAGAWIGACLGVEGSPRAMMRGLSAGAIEGAVHAALNDTLDRHRALIGAGSLITINLLFYWFASVIIGTSRDFAVISEAQWEKGVPRRAWMSSVLWLYLKNARLDDAPRSTVVAVQLLRQVSRIGILVLALWLMGFSPPQIWRQLLVTLAGRPAMAPTP
jgi:hypothetical protein